MGAPPQFERYDIHAVLGRGGFATVYRATDRMLGRDVALKLLHPHIAADPQATTRFRAEARRLARLRHPHIVTVFDVSALDGAPFFTMELLLGETLARLLAPGQGLDLAQVAAVLAPLGAALDYLHDHGIVHRDVKAANVIVEQEDGRVVLMDLGIASVLEQPGDTPTGHIVGTPEAMAPEQIRGGRIGPETDLYALGVLAYRLLGGRPPFSGPTEQVLFAHVYTPPPPLREIRPGLPDAVYAVIAAALSKDPAARPASATALAAALRPAGPAPPFPSRTLPLLHEPPAVATLLPEPPVEVTPTEALPRGEPPVPATTQRAGDLGGALARDRRRVASIAGAALLLVLAGTIASTHWLAGGAGARPTPITAQRPAPTPSDTTEGSAGTPAPPPTPTPTPTPLSAAAVPDAALLRPGAQLVQRGLLAEGNGPGTIVLFSQAPGADGCPQPYLDLFHPAADGTWIRVWDATAVPHDNVLLPPVHRSSDSTCYPALALHAVRSLEQGSAPQVLSAVTLDGRRQRLTVLAWDTARRQGTLLADLTTTPDAALNLADGQPATVGVAENAYPPPSSGLNPQYDQPTGQLSLLLTWQGGTLQAGSEQLTPNCTSGTLTASTHSATGKALQWTCADGRTAAAAVGDGTTFDAQVRFDDLAAGDDVSVTFVASSLAVADPLGALATAASVHSSAAAARKAPTPAPAPSVAPPAPVHITAPANTGGGGSTTSPPVQPARVPTTSLPPPPQPAQVPAPVATIPPQPGTGPPPAPAATIPPQALGPE